MVPIFKAVVYDILKKKTVFIRDLSFITLTSHEEVRVLQKPPQFIHDNMRI